MGQVSEKFSREQPEKESMEWRIKNYCIFFFHFWTIIVKLPNFFARYAMHYMLQLWLLITLLLHCLRVNSIGFFRAKIPFLLRFLFNFILNFCDSFTTFLVYYFLVAPLYVVGKNAILNNQENYLKFVCVQEVRWVN